METREIIFFWLKIFLYSLAWYIIRVYTSSNICIHAFLFSRHSSSTCSNGKTLSLYIVSVFVVGKGYHCPRVKSSSFTQQQSKYFSFFDQSSRVCTHRSGVNPRGFNVQHSSWHAFVVVLIRDNCASLRFRASPPPGSLNTFSFLDRPLIPLHLCAIPLNTSGTVRLDSWKL